MSANNIVTADNTTSDQPVAGSLSPVLSTRYALSWQHAAVCLFFSIVFVYLSYMPLFHAETWLHAAHGKWLLEHQSLATAEPFLPLADGMPYMSTSWFSQLTFASVAQWFGAEGLSALLALTQITTLILLSVAFYRQTRRKRLMLFGLIFVLALWWGQLGILRPQVFGGLCLGLLLLMLIQLPQWNWRSRVTEVEKESTDPINSAAAFPRWMWVLVPLLMLAWANLDGSFVVGLVVLASHALGRMIEVAISQSQQRIKAIALDQAVRQWVWLTELSLVATLINPLGLDLWAQAVRFDSNSLWQSSGGWQPLLMTSFIGVGFAAFWVLALCLLRISHVRIHPTDVILLGAVSLAVICNGLLIWWFAPLAILVAMPYLAEVFARRDREESNIAQTETVSEGSEKEPKPLRFAFTLVSLLILWGAFALSPISSPILGGKPRKVTQLHNAHTPLGVSNYLSEHPPQKMVWAPQHWGDWLIWDGPAEMQIYANSDAPILPQQVRYDYGRVLRGDGGWQEVLDRYDVGTLVIEKEKQPELLHSAKRSSEQWGIAYEDDLALVMTRRGDQVVQLEREVAAN